MFILTFNMFGKALTLRKSTNKFGNSFTKSYLCSGIIQQDILDDLIVFTLCTGEKGERGK